MSGSVRPEGAFAWRDFMVPGYEDIAKAEYLESKGIELLRGGAQLAGAECVVSNCSPGTFSSSACLARSRHSARAVGPAQT